MLAQDRFVVRNIGHPDAQAVVGVQGLVGAELVPTVVRDEERRGLVHVGGDERDVPGPFRRDGDTYHRHVADPVSERTRALSELDVDKLEGHAELPRQMVGHGDVMPHESPRCVHEGEGKGISPIAHPENATLAAVVDMLLTRDRDEEAETAATALGDVCAPLDEELLNRAGYAFLRKDRVDAAVRLFRRNVELHPESANPYDSLGEALEEAGDRDGARENYTRAVELARRNADPALPAFERNLQRINQ